MGQERHMCPLESVAIFIYWKLCMFASFLSDGQSPRSNLLLRNTEEYFTLRECWALQFCFLSSKSKVWLFTFVTKLSLKELNSKALLTLKVAYVMPDNSKCHVDWQSIKESWQHICMYKHLLDDNSESLRDQ